jgi:hypothetical protein
VSYEILIKIKEGPESGYYLGSTTDVTDLGKWIGTLPTDSTPGLQALILDGGAADTGSTCSEIGPALEDHDPRDQSIAETAQALEEILDRWPDGTTARLSDGVND